MDYQKYILPHIWNLKPYSSARDEFKGNEGIFLDANENPLGSPTTHHWNRYPDPYQLEIKEKLSKIKNCPKENIFLGNGSDEAIDLLIRMTCTPGQQEIIICPPTYGMYEVSANINNIDLVKVDLTDNYQLDIPTIFKAINHKTRLIFICSPNNPTGNKINRIDIYQILNHFTEGFVVIDEAYIDFSDEPSFLLELKQFPNLIVLQTLSKAYGLASLRLGMAFANEVLINLFNKIKPPYNISGATQEQVIVALDNKDFVNNSIKEIRSQIKYLISELELISNVIKIYPSDANFLLVKFNEANRLFDYLITQKVITRNRSSVPLCSDTIRITIGTQLENSSLIQNIKEFYNH